MTTESKPLYRAWRRKDPSWTSPPTARLRELLIYDDEPSGNLFGSLPLGTMPKPRTADGSSPGGTFYRTDGGDPYEHALFVSRNGEEIVVERTR